MIDKLFYIYRHINSINNEVFYIGKGTLNPNKKSFKKQYERAFSFSGRNDLWNKIYKKYGCIVEIIFESESESFIFEKETEFINLYGRRNLNKGLLANLTDGGEGETGRFVSEELKQKYALINKGRKHSKEINLKKGSKGKDNFFYGKKLNGCKNGFYGKKHTEETKDKLRGENNPMYGKTGDKNPFYGKTHSKEFLRKKQVVQSNKVEVFQDGNLIEFECVSDCAKYFKCTNENIHRVDKVLKNNGVIKFGKFKNIYIKVLK